MSKKRIQYGILFLVGFALLFFLGSFISQGTAFAFSISSVKNKIVYAYSSNKTVPFLASLPLETFPKSYQRQKVLQ